jgi:hypothetical protein
VVVPAAFLAAVRGVPLVPRAPVLFVARAVFFAGVAPFRD